MKLLFFLSALFIISGPVEAKTWLVGPTRQYTAPSKVMGLAANGDTVAIDSGLYSGDVGEWKQNNLYLYCPNGRARLFANGQNAGEKGIWIVSGNNTTIENIEFFGEAISAAEGNNGAGIRMQGSGLTLRNCFIHDNQDGVLTGADTTSDIVFEACEFARNGAGDGYSHNMYIGNDRSFTLQYCYVHEASVGHEVKSRANHNYILYNLIVDKDSTSSYDVDLPNGGFSIVMGNSIMKGPNAQNTVLVNFGEEGLKNPDPELYVINNTMLSTRGGSTLFIQAASGTSIAEARNNIFAGAGSYASANVSLGSSAASADTSYFHFEDVTSYDYRLTVAYPTMHSGTDPGSVDAFGLLPTNEYVFPLDSAARSDNPPAIGAFHFPGSNAVSSNFGSQSNPMNFPNPFSTSTRIQLPEILDGKNILFTLYNERGEVVATNVSRVSNRSITIDRNNLPSGVYFWRVATEDPNELTRGSIVISAR